METIQPSLDFLKQLVARPFEEEFSKDSSKHHYKNNYNQQENHCSETNYKLSFEREHHYFFAIGLKYSEENKLWVSIYTGNDINNITRSKTMTLVDVKKVIDAFNSKLSQLYQPISYSDIVNIVLAEKF